MVIELGNLPEKSNNYTIGNTGGKLHNHLMSLLDLS